MLLESKPNRKKKINAESPVGARESWMARPTRAYGNSLGKTCGCVESCHWLWVEWTQKTLESRICRRPISRGGDSNKDRGREGKTSGQEKAVSWCKKKRYNASACVTLEMLWCLIWFDHSRPLWPNCLPVCSSVKWLQLWIANLLTFDIYISLPLINRSLCRQTE